MPVTVKHLGSAISWGISLLMVWVAILAGCASAPEVATTRLGRTGIDRDMTIATIVLADERCAEHREKTGTNCASPEAIARSNDVFVGCLDRAIKVGKHAINVMPGHVFHLRFLAGIQPSYELLDAETVPELLAVPAIQHAVSAANIGYVILLQSTTTDSDRHTTFGAGGAAWAVGRESTRETTLVASVWSVLPSTKVGELEQRAHGQTGWMVPVLIIIPFPPIPYTSDTESKACEAMGHALAEFLYSEAGQLR